MKRVISILIFILFLVFRQSAGIYIEETLPGDPGSRYHIHFILDPQSPVGNLDNEKRDIQPIPGVFTEFHNKEDKFPGTSEGIFQVIPFQNKPGPLLTDRPPPANGLNSAA